MRNDNFVYEDELFYISSSETVSGKNPQLVVDYKPGEFASTDLHNNTK